MSTEFTVSGIETATYSAGRGSTIIEHPSLLAQVTAWVLDADGNVLSTQDSSGSWTSAAVGNLGPVPTLDWACHSESWLKTASDVGVSSVSERTLSWGVTAVVFTVQRPFDIPDQGIETTMDVHNDYDKATGRMLLQEVPATGALNGRPFTMELLQELVPTGQ